MKFNQLEHSKKFVSNPGSVWKDIYHGEVQPDGSIKLVFDKKENFYKRIQADSVGCDLPSIIARATAGDPTAFRQDAGFFGDVVGMPQTYADILNQVNAGKAKFESLPLDVREKFDFNFEKWFATLGSKEWISNMGLDNFSQEKTDQLVDPVGQDNS